MCLERKLMYISSMVTYSIVKDYYDALFINDIMKILNVKVVTI